MIIRGRHGGRGGGRTNNLQNASVTEAWPSQRAQVFSGVFWWPPPSCKKKSWVRLRSHERQPPTKTRRPSVRPSGDVLFILFFHSAVVASLRLRRRPKLKTKLKPRLIADVRFLVRVSYSYIADIYFKFRNRNTYDRSKHHDPLILHALLYAYVGRWRYIDVWLRTLFSLFGKIENNIVICIERFVHYSW